jgi:hypothetical protein
MSSLKINILNLTDKTKHELKNLFDMVKIDINQLLTYMELQRFEHEKMIRDLTTIVDHGDQWNQEPAKVQRLSELAMSNAYHNVIEKLKSFDTRPRSNMRFSKVNIRQMVKEINEDLEKEKPVLKRALVELDEMIADFNEN